jgi:co-chaperonin GroES (HSP10)
MSNIRPIQSDTPDLDNCEMLGEYVLIRPEPGAAMPNGIVIPEKFRERTYRGEVVKHGPGLIDQKGVFHRTELKEGDRVLYSPWNTGWDLELDGVLFNVQLESEVRSIVLEGDPEPSPGRA